MSEPLQACRDGRFLKKLFLGTSHYKPDSVSIAKGQEICWVKACRAVQCRHGLFLGYFAKHIHFSGPVDHSICVHRHIVPYSYVLLHAKII